MKGCQRGFTVEGLNLERFIRQAGERNILLSRLRRSGRKMSALADEDTLPLLLELAEQGGWRLSIGRRHGAGRIADLIKGRRLLLIALTAAGLCMAVASQMMWRVEIHDAGVYQADLERYLTAQGIRPMIWKRSLDLAALRDELEWRYPKVAWVECGWRGMTLKITLVEGVAQGETLGHTGAGDVVALRDGVVDSVITVAGTAQVKVGDIVRKGQILILGQERTSDDLIRPVAARGQVLARVWDGAVVRMSAEETSTIYTGESEEVWMVTCPWFSLWKPEPSQFNDEDVAVRELPLGGLFFPLSYRVETRLEADHVVKPRDLEQLKAEAGIAALRLLRQKIGIHDDLVDKWVDYCMIEGEILEAVGIGERLVDIAQQVRYDSPQSSADMAASAR